MIHLPGPVTTPHLTASVLVLGLAGAGDRLGGLVSFSLIRVSTHFSLVANLELMPASS